MAKNRFRRKEDEEEEKVKKLKAETEEDSPQEASEPKSTPADPGVRSGSRGKVVTQKAWNQTQNIAKTREALEDTKYSVTDRNWDADDSLGKKRYNARLARHAAGLYTEEEKLETKPNKMRVDFGSIKDNEQAVFVAAAMHGASEQKFLEDYAKHTNQNPEVLYREAESHEDLFSGALSTQSRMKELGLMNLKGEDIDLDTAGPDTIVQAIRDIVDTDKRKEATKLFQSMTRDKDSRFYGYNAYVQDYSFRDSAALTESGYKKYAKDLDGRFDPREDALEKSLRIYVSEYDKLAAQGNYVLRQELPLLEQAFAQQMGLDSAPDVEKIREKLRVEDSIRATRELGGKGKKGNGNDRSTWQKIGDWWNEFTEGAKQKWEDAWADEEEEEEPEAAGPTYQKPDLQPTPTIDEQIADRAASAPKTEKQPGTQGPAYQKQEEATKTIDQLIAENAERRPLPKEELEAFGPEYQKPEALKGPTPTIDERIASRAAKTPKSEKEAEVFGPEYIKPTIDEQIANRAANAHKTEKAAPSVQPGSVDLAGQPIEALVGYVFKGNGDALTDETEAEVEAFVRSSPEMMALLGILSDEELSIVKTTEDMPYMAVSRNTGMLGPLSPYARKIHSKGLLKELTDDAASMLISLVQEAAQMPLTREETELVEAGFTNRCEIFFEKNQDKLEALDAAFSLSEELRMEALGRKDVSSQEALDKARKRCRSGFATEADWKLVYDHAPVTTPAQKYGDKTYAEAVGSIAKMLDESYATDSTDNWINKQTLLYLHENGLYKDLFSKEALHYKAELEGYLREALAGEYDTAYALGYKDLGEYWSGTGAGSMIDLQEKALALQERDARTMSEPEETPLYKGDGSAETGEAVVEGTKLGFEQKKQQAYEALATLGVVTNTEAERFAVTTHYYNTGSFTDAEIRCKSDLYQMIEQGYFPNEDVAGYVKDYLDNGGSALELGIMPSDFGWAAARNAEEARQRAEDIQAWAHEKLNLKQGKYFEVAASTSLNAANQLENIVLTLPLAATGASGFGRLLFGSLSAMASYGAPTYLEGVSEGLKGGADLTGANIMGTSMAFAQSVAEMFIDIGIADDVARAMGIKDIVGTGLEHAGWTASRRFWNAVKTAGWRTGVVVTEEVTKDEFFGGTFTEAAKTGTWKAIELTDGFTELPNASELMKIAGAAMSGGISAIGPTTRELIANMGENAIMTLPIALMTGMAAGSADWRSTRAVRTAMETGKPEAVKQAGEAIVEDMNDPEKAQALDAAALEARISAIANDLMLYDPGEIGTKMAAARLAKEQSDSHKSTYTKSYKANKVAQTTMANAQAKLNAGDTSKENMLALKKAQEAFAKTRNNMDESWREYQEKKAESDSLHAEAYTMARNEAAKQVQQERAGLAQRAQETQEAREQEQTEADLRAMEVEAFIAENHPDADDAQKDQIRKDLEGADFGPIELETQEEESGDITPEKRQEMYNAYRFTSSISKIFGVKIRMAGDNDVVLEGDEGAYDHDTGEIVINKSATPDQILRRVVMHELTHRAEHSVRYQQLADALIQIKFGGDMDAYQSELDSVTRLYSADHELAPGEAERELVARIAGEILGGNQDFINRFVQEKPSIAQRFADTIKSVIDRLRGVKGSKELARLRKVEKMFRKALEDAKAEYESGADLTQSGVSKSLPLDKKEWAQFYNKIGEIKIGKDPQFMDAANGEKILEINNKLVYTDGNWDNPRVSTVVEIDLENENDVDLMRGLWYEAEEGVRSSYDEARAIAQSVYGKEVFRQHDSGASGESERGAGGRARGQGGRTDEGDRRGRRVSKSLPSTGSTQKEFDVWRKNRGNSLAQRNQLEEANQQTGGHGDGERQFVTKTAPKSEAMPEWLKAELYANPEQRYYLKDTNNDQLMRAWGEILHNGYEQTRDRLLQLDHMTADDVAASNVVMAMAFRNGDMNTAMLMAHKYNTDGTLTAKALQARKLFSRMTPTGLKAKVAGEYERKTAEYMDSHEPAMKKVRSRAKRVEDKIKGLQGGDELLRLNAAGSYTVDASNKWGMPINEQQAELIRQYKLDNVPRPGENFYNRSTTKQRMLEAILATPNPLELTGNGLNLIERLEMLSDGLAVVTNADLNYIGRQLALYAYADADTQQGREGDLALSRAYEAYGNIEPATFSEKMRTWGYVSMLLSVPSAIRNVIGNAGQNTLNAAADGLAIWLDKKISEKTGQRTRANLTWKERAEGWHAFVQETKYTWRDYFKDKAVSQKGEERFSLNQRGRVYQTPALEAARLVEGYLMSVGDRNFWKMKYVNAMAEQMRLAELNGVEFDYDAAVETAEAEANYATFTEDSKVKTLLSQAKQIPGIGWLVHFTMPFTGVPTSIAKRSLEYSPMGVVATAIRLGVNAAKGETFDQRAFVNGMSRGLTGTAMWGIGMALMQFGLIHLGTSEDEDDLYNLNTAQGEQYSPYIQVGDEYVSLAAFAPSVSSMIMGAKFYEMLKDDESKLNAVYNACFASLDQIIDASYLSGLQDFFEALSSDGAAGAMTSIASNAVSQNIPAVLGQIATCLDPYVRDTKDVNDIMAIAKSVASKIPILREEVLSAKVDITGEKVTSKEGLRNFFDPFTTTDVRNDATLDELERLWRETGGDVSIPGFLIPNTGKITILKDVADAVGMDRAAGENKLVLSGEQRVKYNEMYGQRVFAAIGAAMTSPDYLYGDDSDRSQIIETLKKNELQEIKLDIQKQICSELGYN